jgi:hypothetical protein
MPDEALLREKARESIRSGKLPLRKPARILGGPGTGETCGVCGLMLTPTDMEIEAEFDRRDGPGKGLDGFHAHPRCYAAWEFERTKIDLPPEPPRLLSV